MQVNAINSFSSVNFAGRHNSKKAEKRNPENLPVQSSKGFMSKLTAPAAAALFLVPAMTVPSSCTKIDVRATAGVTIPFTPCPSDTVVIRDTIYIPPEFEFPYEISDSLNHWRGEILDVPVEGDDGNLDNKALLYLAGKRQYFMDRPEYIKLNLERSRNDEARYDHVIADSIKNDISITKVEPGDITVVKGDGTITDNVSGLMFNEDGYKTFAHSNGKDSIYVYPKMTSGEYNGKFVQNNVVGRGYLDKSRYGENVLLITYMEPATPNEYATQEHYIDVEGLTMDVDQLKDMAEEKVIIED